MYENILLGFMEKYLLPSSARMIPIAISSSEADYIRKLLKSQNRNRLKAKTIKEHPRLPRKIIKNQEDVKHLKSGGVDAEQEYQIIYKTKPTTEAAPNKSATLRTQFNKTNNDGNNSNLNTTILAVRPRGPPRGFFNKDRFKEIFTGNSAGGTDRDQSKGEN